MGGARKVLVLGATGFFGSWIAHELEASDRNGGSRFEVERASRPTGDLLDPEGLRRLIAASRPDAIVNAAGLTSPAAAKADPPGCFAVNAGGMANLLEAVRQESPEAHLIALSSAAVYAGAPPFDENSPTAPDTPYAASKLAMELLCAQYARSPGLAVTVLRCFNLTGPGEPAGQATSEFALAALDAGADGRAEVRVGDPSTARDFTDVRDAARAVRLRLEQGAGRDDAKADLFNLCSGEARSLSELAARIGRLAGVELVLRGSGSGRPASGLPTVRGLNAKLRQATGWRPEIPLETSLGDLIASRRDPG